MKAIIYDDVNNYNFVDNFEEPKMNNQLNVKIKVLYCGICGSDIHKLLFEKPNKDYVKTRVLGHEIAGIVVDKMKNVMDDIQIGDKVVVEPLLYCNDCDMCKKGYIQFCENLKSLGKDFQGGFAEYLVTNEQQLHKISNNVDTLIATLSDPYSVAIHISNMVQKKVHNKKDIKVAIIGDGIIGMACAELLYYGNEVVVFGKHNNRANILKKINVSYINIKCIDRYLDYFDVIIEAVGGRQSKTLEDAIRISHKKGIIFVAGVYDNNFKFDISLRNAFYKELSIIGCNSFEKEGNISDFESALNFLSNDSIIAPDLISKTYDISDFYSAIEYIKNRKINECIKVMIKM